MDLNLDKVGVEIDDRNRVAVNDNLQTLKHSHIYACGDVIRGPMLAHKAEEEGIFVAEQAAGHFGHLNYNSIPAVIYTHPELASVGKTEEELKAEGVAYNKGTFPFMANSRARANHDTDGLVKVLSDKETDKLIGCHIVGPTAGDLIMEAVLGIEYNASSEDLARTVHAHPGFGEAIKEACLATFTKAIHF
jgi:dihydrolipoamide dehydrogenase